MACSEEACVVAGLFPLPADLDAHASAAALLHGEQGGLQFALHQALSADFPLHAQSVCCFMGVELDCIPSG
jgi:hypothetical protein